ncbi:MAG TPA: dihydropteroate synthase [Thermoanaerobaculia bacterium]|nr:dihydropteroate synthase [Thermoanaerobaculia bacterium]
MKDEVEKDEVVKSEAPSSFILHPSSFRLPRARILQFTRPPRIMGILNVTPDSFSDGGVHFDQSKAVHAALQMEEDGAGVIDIGGESTRPGAEAVSADEEIGRTVPVIEQIRRRSAVPISIDTRKAAVAAAALDAGADIVNDVTALRGDPAMRALVAERGVPAILMHMRGEPRTMQQMTEYDDVVEDVWRELAGFREAAIGAGIDAAQIAVDPGIGFAKTFDQNLELLARCRRFAELGPVLIGASRKAFIGHLTGRPAGAERSLGSLAAVAAAFRGGAAMVRVHDVRDTADFLSVLGAIAEKEEA